jgi:hypothetical protein
MNLPCPAVILGLIWQGIGADSKGRGTLARRCRTVPHLGMLTRHIWSCWRIRFSLEANLPYGPPELNLRARKRERSPAG